VRLLQGFPTLDDGIAGERVTPTGAAIVRHLCSTVPARPAQRRLLRTGNGFGLRELPGLSNCLRVLVFDEVQPEVSERSAATTPGGDHRELLVIEFEVDDQSPEELAAGVDRLRTREDVFDVVQMPVFGKKGRIMSSLRLLARPDACDAVIAACFRETTTIGLRYRTMAAVALRRNLRAIDVDGCSVRVKVVERPGGVTAKADCDDALAAGGHAERAALRRLAEGRALAPENSP
jgi:uncharacterized protein (DUF111 family)